MSTQRLIDAQRAMQQAVREYVRAQFLDGGKPSSTLTRTRNMITRTENAAWGAITEEYYKSSGKLIRNDTEIDADVREAIVQKLPV